MYMCINYTMYILLYAGDIEEPHTDLSSGNNAFIPQATSKGKKKKAATPAQAVPAASQKTRTAAPT